MSTYDHVHFGSGGFGTLCFLGALNYIERELGSQYNVSGTSAGAMLAFLVVIGYTSSELMTLVYDKLDNGILNTSFFDWHTIEHYEATGVLLDFQKTWDLLGNMCRARLGDIYDLDTLTFAKLYEACGGRRLSVVATSVTEARMTVFNIDTHPDMLVRQAIEASTSIPLLAGLVSYDGEMFVDGFVTDTAVIGKCPLIIRVSGRTSDKVARADCPDFFTHVARMFDAMMNSTANALCERNASFTIVIDDVVYQNLSVSGMTRNDLFDTFIRGYDATARFFKKRV